ncbi:hypothetical protein [Paraburkholderia fynbosensis]|uniref:Uncharacterized protein n=1 Tax=Paraburkholderia fynbosensis TaxID=1200993 RepID=A0A6J5GLW8_9BURK|nr:hypothetical protein [Paraburkholderia fynbosensis]CAB3803240.1 hypothetical protein LMG27177_05417 [Paraburkholderia fynbosensis]
MDANLVKRIALALQEAARNRTLLPYQRLHAMLPGQLPVSLRYDVLEAAAKKLEDLEICDYGVLLALDSGMPGSDFFLRFRRRRLADYILALGDPRYTRPTRKMKTALVAAERARVYQHAVSCATARPVAERV